MATAFTTISRVAQCENYDAEYYNMGKDNDGEEIWTNLTGKYPNISMVLSGHIVKAAGQMSAGHETQAGTYGNTVNEMMADYQAMANGGNGYLRILKFSPSQNTIQVSTLFNHVENLHDGFCECVHSSVAHGHDRWQRLDYGQGEKSVMQCSLRSKSFVPRRIHNNRTATASSR